METDRKKMFNNKRKKIPPKSEPIIFIAVKYN